MRIALLLAVAVASSRLTALADRSGATTGWLAIHLAMALISIAALSMSRLGGLSLDHPDFRQSRPRQWQFSLLSLVSAMTSVALVAAVWRWATLPWLESSQTWWAIAHILAAETAITCICLIVPLAPGAWWKGASIAIAGTFAITFTFFGLPSLSNPHANMSTLSGLLTALVAMLLRIGDYRLEWRPGWNTSSISKSTDPST